MEFGLLLIAFGLFFVGFQIRNYTETYALVSGKYISDDEARKLYSQLEVFFVTNVEEEVVILIGRDKYKLNAYEEYLVRRNLLESATMDKVKVDTKKDDILSLIHLKLHS